MSRMAGFEQAGAPQLPIRATGKIRNNGIHFNWTKRARAFGPTSGRPNAGRRPCQTKLLS